MSVDVLMSDGHRGWQKVTLSHSRLNDISKLICGHRHDGMQWYEVACIVGLTVHDTKKLFEWRRHHMFNHALDCFMEEGYSFKRAVAKTNSLFIGLVDTVVFDDVVVPFRSGAR